MIKIERPAKPAELTDEVKESLTAEYKETEASVWRKDWIVEPLLAASYNKCAFSEMRLNQEGKYMQVEHFHPKKKYPDEVVEWTNLLPISNVCNAKKNDWDTKQKPLVNPMDEDPKEYFYIRNGRINAKDKRNKKATDTIERYDLNNPDQLRSVRCDIEDKIKEELKDIADHYSQDKDFWAQKLLKLMSSSGRQTDYSATKATAILLNAAFKVIKQQLIDDSFWSDDFVNAESELAFCALI